MTYLAKASLCESGARFLALDVTEVLLTSIAASWQTNALVREQLCNSFEAFFFTLIVFTHRKDLLKWKTKLQKMSSSYIPLHLQNNLVQLQQGASVNKKSSKNGCESTVLNETKA